MRMTADPQICSDVTTAGVAAGGASFSSSLEAPDAASVGLAELRFASVGVSLDTAVEEAARRARRREGSSVYCSKTDGPGRWR